jgi:predicted O-methyltransferase YrrM
VRPPPIVAARARFAAAGECARHSYKTPPRSAMADALNSGSPTTMSDALGKYARRNGLLAGTDKTTTHAYGPLYDALFGPYRERARRVLEIGVHTGASVLAFADFFVNATIDGVDIDYRDLKFGINHPRIAYYLLDGTSPDTAAKLGGSYDVIVEDASHRPDHQVASLDAFAPRLSPGGVYVIEDIGDVGVRPRLEETAARHGLAMEWHDLRGVKGQFDDVVAVFFAK